MLEDAVILTKLLLSRGVSHINASEWYVEKQSCSDVSNLFYGNIEDVKRSL